VETLIATALLVTVLAGVAQLLTSSARFLLDSGRGETALTAAQAQIETLRAAAWTYDPSGAAVSDPALAASPAGALEVDTDGYADYLTAHGHLVAPGDSAALFRRRWAIQPVEGDGPDAIVIEVCVSRIADERAPQPADACLMTIRTRQP
jgi:hypothetical protein